MAYLTKADVSAALARSDASRPIVKIAEVVLREHAAATPATAHFDVFLSHSLKDADEVLAVKLYLEEQGLKVYVDWVVDPQLDRKNVTPATANHLRQRMAMSDTMIFAVSVYSPDSKWMPWELGYFDGLRHGRIAILPLLSAEGATFNDQQYLGLYPKVEKLVAGGRDRLYVTRGVGTRTFMEMSEFKRGSTTFHSMTK